MLKVATAPGAALGGGSVFAMAHIGVLQAMIAAGRRPSVVAGASGGSVVGAALAAAMPLREMARLMNSSFWPALVLQRPILERFCATHLPRDFAELRIPFAAVVRDSEGRRLALTSGDLTSALVASCSFGLPYEREGRWLRDGGVGTRFLVQVCRRLGARSVVASDVWTENAPPLLRLLARPELDAGDAEVVVRPRLPLLGRAPVPGAAALLVAAGRRAAEEALDASESNICASRIEPAGIRSRGPRHTAGPLL